MDNISISIIVPVYNVEKYLLECIESLVNQTINNIEIIFINDGSTDRSLDILNKCKDFRVKVINQDNKGQGAARNLAFDIAKGKYISFVDSDDKINLNMLEKMYLLAERNEADIVVCGVNTFKYDAEESNNIDNKVLILDRYEAIKKFLTFEIEGFACAKLFRKALLCENNIKFEENTYYEDMFMIIKAINFSEKVVVTNEKLYNYRQRVDATTSVIKEKNVLDYAKQVLLCYNFAKLQTCEDIYIESYQCISFIRGLSKYICLYGLSYKKIKESISKIFDSEYLNIKLINVISNKNISKKYKIIFVLWKSKIYHIYIWLRLRNSFRG